ncbi:MAG: FKBP-type peptidyl-prolyl cis-trans isomerase [Planctomycetota bacterium]|nr:FKBP-type peptidyl-prolyl cis-trans isomerase [Planctomycetota bacterium]
MKQTITVFVTLLFFVLSSFATGQEKKDANGTGELKSLKQKASYLVGFDIGEDVLRRELDVDYAILIRGFLDAVNKKNPPMTDAEMKSVMAAFEKQVAEKANAKWKALARTNLEQGIRFLNQNKLAEGVIQLESGLQYRVIKAAEGGQPVNGQRVKIHVRGKHVDGKVFEDTNEQKQPISITVGTTLRGLDEALRRMSVGEKWELYIPADKAFGQRGSPPAIGPNETLVYEVELIEIEKK